MTTCLQAPNVDAPAATLRDGRRKPDPDLRELVEVPLHVSAQDFFEREVAPYYPDAWIEETGKRLGAEIPFDKLFFSPSRINDAETTDAILRDSVRAAVSALEAVTRVR